MSKNTINLAEFKIQINSDDIQKTIDKQIESKTREVIETQMRSLFKQTTRYTPTGVVVENGAASIIIEELIMQRFTDESLKSYINKYITENFEKHMQEALSKACQHVANKTVFQSQQIKQRTV